MREECTFITLTPKTAAHHILKYFNIGREKTLIKQNRRLLYI